MIKKTLIINGVTRNLVLDKDETLATVLREHLLLTGCKIGCGEGHCGACNVIMNGKVTKACIFKMSKVPDNAEITTIEGVGTLTDMHPLQVAWMAYGCAQCGFCTPGFIISAKVLLENNPNPTREEVRDWFNKQRNLCRCTGYKPLVDATMAAAAVLRGECSKEDLIFKPTGDSIKGSKYIRPSAAQKVTGTWDFGADDALKMPGCLRLALTQAKVSHANIKNIDISEAEKMPGVVKVITYKDILAAGGTNQINGLVMLPKHNKTDGFERPSTPWLPTPLRSTPALPTSSMKPTASRARTSTGIPSPTSSRSRSRATAPVSPTCTSSRTTATATLTRTAWSPCIPSPSVSTCTCP